MTPGQAQDPLAQLHPLRQPPEITWWPPAPGWWLLLALVLVLLLALCWLAWRRHRARRYRREAAARMEALLGAYRADPTTPFATSCNRLLKAVALRSFPNRDVAGLHGDAWLAFLNSTAPDRARKNQPLFTRDFTDQLYRPQAGPDDVDRLYRAALRWVLGHGAGR